MSAVLDTQEPSAHCVEVLHPALVQQFDLVASAKSGVARLRELILTLAVQGRLAPQVPSDQQASVQLQRILAESEALVAAGKRKREQIEPVFTEEDAPFVLPPNWEWVRLGCVLEMVNGKAFKSTEWAPAGMPIVRIQNLNNERAPFNYCDPATVPNRHRIDDGELLISWSGTPGTSFGAFIWRRGSAALNQHIFKCRILGAAYVPEFLKLAINSQLHILIAGAQGGVGLQHVTKGTLENLALVLPPLAEQSRIVARVDQLMSLCDALESKGRLEAEQHARLLKTLLDTLTDSGSPEELAARWERVACHFDLLLDRSDAVDALEKTILLLAVRGTLAHPNPTDEAASNLLQAIRTDKQDINTRKRRTVVAEARKPQDDQGLFSIPAHWTWCVLDDIAIQGPSNGLSPNPVDGPTPVRCLSLSATTQAHFKAECFKYVDVPDAVATPFLLKRGDLLIQRGNSLEYVGIAALYDGDDDAYIFPDLMMRVRLSPRVNARFVHICLVCEHGRDYFRRNATGTQGTMPKVNQATVASAPIPLPPIAEQDRIVACVDQLRRVCSDLRERLTAAQELQARFAEVLIQEATQPQV